MFFSVYLFKEKLSRGKIELAIANWFKDKASLQSIFISEPVYVEDASDRIDVVMFVGGFDVTKMFVSMEKKVEWQAIVKSLVTH